MIRFLVVSLLLAIIAGCAAQPRSPYAPGGAFHGVFEIGNHRIPLPDGEWHFVAHHVYQNRDRQAFADVQLVQIDEQTRVLTRGVLISANLESIPQVEVPKAAFCERGSVYHRSVISNERGSDQDCWVVSYFRASVGRKTDKVSAQTLAYLLNQRVSYPHFAIYTAYRLVSDSNNLTVQYYFNPEYQTAIAPSPRVSWKRSPWHFDHYAKDPEKVAYIERMKLWSGEWYEQVKLGFAMN